MTTIFGHTRALQFSAASVLFTAAVTALPLFAASEFDTSYFDRQIVQTFQKLGAATTNDYNNGSLATSAFDFAMYFSDTCYRPTEFDTPRCTEKFGPYANLKETYESGALAAIMNRVSYLKGITALLPGGTVTSSSSSSSSSLSSSAPASDVLSSSSSRDLLNRADRGHQVWNLCTKKTLTRGLAVRCYQRNIRLITERIEPIDESLIY